MVMIFIIITDIDSQTHTVTDTHSDTDNHTHNDNHLRVMIMTIIYSYC